jgi:transcriptional regulator with XRE-family HTH domain
VLVLISDSIRIRREELGLAQSDVARVLGVTQQTVSRWERGLDVPPAVRVAPLAQLLEMAASDLLRLAGYLPDEERSSAHGAFEAMLREISVLTDVELMLLIDAAWQTFRDRQALALPEPIEAIDASS